MIISHESQKSFEILGISPTSSLEQAKHAYRSKAKLYHPDFFAKDPLSQKQAEIKMKEVNAAYHKIVVFIKSNSSSANNISPKNSQQFSKPIKTSNNTEETLKDLLSLFYQSFIWFCQKIKDIHSDYKFAYDPLDNIESCEKKSNKVIKKTDFKSMLNDKLNKYDCVAKNSFKERSCKRRRQYSAYRKKIYSNYYRLKKSRSVSDGAPIEGITPISRVRGIKQ